MTARDAGGVTPWWRRINPTREEERSFVLLTLYYLRMGLAFGIVSAPFIIAWTWWNR